MPGAIDGAERGEDRQRPLEGRARAGEVAGGTKKGRLSDEGLRDLVAGPHLLEDAGRAREVPEGALVLRAEGFGEEPLGDALQMAIPELAGARQHRVEHGARLGAPSEGEMPFRQPQREKRARILQM